MVPRLNFLCAFSDGVPTMIPESFGYRHQCVQPVISITTRLLTVHVSSASEYWQFQEPRKFGVIETRTWSHVKGTANTTTVRRCEGQEDPQCSHSIRILILARCPSGPFPLTSLLYAASLGVNPAHWVYFGQGARFPRRPKDRVILTSMFSSDDLGFYPLFLVPSSFFVPIGHYNLLASNQSVMRYASRQVSNSGPLFDELQPFLFGYVTLRQACSCKS